MTCFAIAPQGDLVGIGSDDGNIRLWSLSSVKVVRTLAVTKKNFIGAIAFSPDGKQIVFHADDELVRVLDIESGTEVGRCAEEVAIVDQLCFAPGGKLVGVVADESGFVWDTDSGKTWKSQQPVSSIAFSPDGDTAALGFNTVRLMDATSGRTISEGRTMEGRVRGLEFSRDGSRLLAVDAGCRGTTARLLNVASGEDSVIGEKIGSDLAGAAYMPDGKTIAVSDGQSTAAFWDVSTGKKTGEIQGLDRSTTTLRFTPDGQRLLTGRNGDACDLLIWDTAKTR